jgi:hypothetical protein
VEDLSDFDPGGHVFGRRVRYENDPVGPYVPGVENIGGLQGRRRWNHSESTEAGAKPLGGHEAKGGDDK